MTSKTLIVAALVVLFGELPSLCYRVNVEFFILLQRSLEPSLESATNVQRVLNRSRAMKEVYASSMWETTTTAK